MSQKSRVLLVINGQVQGVFFRYRAQQKAEFLGLTGWVKNNHNGSVECLAEGAKDKLEDLITWVQTGVVLAKVESIAIKWLPFEGEFKSFSII